MNVNVINHVMKHLDYKKCKCRRKLIDKLVLTWEDEILNTNETSFDGKKKYHIKMLPYLYHFIDNYMHTIIS